MHELSLDLLLINDWVQLKNVLVNEWVQLKNVLVNEWVQLKNVLRHDLFIIMYKVKINHYASTIKR